MAEQVEQGTAYHEPVEVYAVDRTKRTVQVHVLSDAEMLTACENANANPQDFKDPEKFTKNLKLVINVAEIAAREPGIGTKLLSGQASKIALKAFELMKPPKE
jgi:hypothetical protein